MLLTPERVRRLLRDVERRRVTVAEAYAALRDLPYEALSEATLDTHRALRRGYPEVVFSEGKSVEQLRAIVERLGGTVDPLILTRLRREPFNALAPQFPQLRYHDSARIASWSRRKSIRRTAHPVIVMTAGTADVPVAEEARVTLELFGRHVHRATDVGVAGLHRLTPHLRVIQRAAAIIVVAGMDGALPSVIGGLAACPVIAVPTSVGYGASFRGIGPLLTMLNTCAPGVVVVNIDNGFGAAYFANMLLDRRAA